KSLSCRRFICLPVGIEQRYRIAFRGLKQAIFFRLSGNNGYPFFSQQLTRTFIVEPKFTLTFGHADDTCTPLYIDGMVIVFYLEITCQVAGCLISVKVYFAESCKALVDFYF